MGEERVTLLCTVVLRIFSAQLYELEKKLNEAEASTQLSSEMSDALEKVWKDLRESKEQNQKLQSKGRIQ